MTAKHQVELISRQIRGAETSQFAFVHLYLKEVETTLLHIY